MKLTIETIQRMEEIFSKFNWTDVDCDQLDQLEDCLFSELPVEIIDSSGGAIEKYGSFENKLKPCDVVEEISDLISKIKSYEEPEKRKALASSFIYKLQTRI